MAHLSRPFAISWQLDLPTCEKLYLNPSRQFRARFYNHFAQLTLVRKRGSFRNLIHNVWHLSNQCRKMLMQLGKPWNLLRFGNLLQSVPIAFLAVKPFCLWYLRARLLMLEITNLQLLWPLHTWPFHTWLPLPLILRSPRVQLSFDGIEFQQTCFDNCAVSPTYQHRCPLLERRRIGWAILCCDRRAASIALRLSAGFYHCRWWQ